MSSQAGSLGRPAVAQGPARSMSGVRGIGRLVVWAVAVAASAVAMRRLALASLVANVAIVVTGGAVRLTGSGLGCPTWPRCVASSYTPTGAMGYHGAVEFTNRTFTGIVGILAVACALAALAQRDR